MKKIIVILFVLFYTTSVISQYKSEGSFSTDNQIIQNDLLTIVKSVLSSKDLQQISNYLSPEAYIILDNKYESLFEVLQNMAKKEKVLGNTDLTFSFMRLWISNDEKTAYLILESKADKKPIWHSIFFNKKESNNWQIINWHKS